MKIRLLLRLVSFLSFFLAIQGERIPEEDVCAGSADCKANYSDSKETEFVAQAVDRDRDYLRNHAAFRFTEFVIAGVNLADYDPENPPTETYSGEVAPFELFEDFDIGHMIQGTENEDWWEFRRYKSTSSYKNPSLAFYFDKVASKRWLMEIGIPIPGIFALNYLSELNSSPDDVEAITQSIFESLPKDTDYCVKPNNNIRSQGVWLVSHDPQTGKTRTSEEASPLVQDDNFSPQDIAGKIAKQLVTPLQDWVPRMCDFIEQGFVIEERFTAFDHDRQPALEFKAFTIFGKFFIANWLRGRWHDQWTPGQIFRNGTMTETSTIQELPDWIDWSRVVELAEWLGANKDFFRTDIFVGVPAGSPALREDATRAERLAAVQYVVSETQPTSSENVPEQVLEEALRLWTAGYKIGNYRLVKNTEVPETYMPNVPKEF